jgi:hypothetical protein
MTPQKLMPITNSNSSMGRLSNVGATVLRFDVERVLRPLLALADVERVTARAPLAGQQRLGLGQALFVDVRVGNLGTAPQQHAGERTANARASARDDDYLPF